MANALLGDVFSKEAKLAATERAVSVALGLCIAAAAQPRPNQWLSFAALVIGVGLHMRGVIGHCPVKALTYAGGSDETFDAQSNVERTGSRLA